MAGEIYGDSFGQLQSNILADRAQRQQALVQSAQLAQQSYAQAQQAQQNAQQHALQIRQLDMQHSQLMDAAAERNRALNIQQQQFDTNRTDRNSQFDRELEYRNRALDVSGAKTTPQASRTEWAAYEDARDSGVLPFSPEIQNRAIQLGYSPEALAYDVDASKQIAKQQELEYANIHDYAGTVTRKIMLEKQSKSWDKAIADATGLRSDSFGYAKWWKGNNKLLDPEIAKMVENKKAVDDELAKINTSLARPEIQPQLEKFNRDLKWNDKLAGIGGLEVDESKRPMPPSMVIKQRLLQMQQSGQTNAPAALDNMPYTPRRADPNIPPLNNTNPRLMTIPPGTQFTTPLSQTNAPQTVTVTNRDGLTIQIPIQSLDGARQRGFAPVGNN